STRSGTSIAAAHVSGAAAFLRAMAPALTVAQARAALTASADDLGTPGFDAQFGWGRLNMDRAAMAAGLLACYANCDGSTMAPALNISDFTCFMSRYNANHPWANCDGS